MDAGLLVLGKAGGAAGEAAVAKEDGRKENEGVVEEDEESVLRFQDFLVVVPLQDKQKKNWVSRSRN